MSYNIHLLAVTRQYRFIVTFWRRSKKTYEQLLWFISPLLAKRGAQGRERCRERQSFGWNRCIHKAVESIPKDKLANELLLFVPWLWGWFFLVESEAIQLQGMGEKIGAHPKPSEQQLLWTPVPHPSVRWIKQLHLSCRSFATRAGEGSQCLLLLQSQPGRAREAPPGSCLPCISSLVSYSSCHHQKPFIRGRCLWRKIHPCCHFLISYLFLIHSGGLFHGYKHTGCWFICS